jgi:hypothetical protein
VKYNCKKAKLIYTAIASLESLFALQINKRREVDKSVRHKFRAVLLIGASRTRTLQLINSAESIPDFSSERRTVVEAGVASLSADSIGNAILHTRSPGILEAIAILAIDTTFRFETAIRTTMNV